MPSHLYSTMKNPPRWWDILLAHALEIAVACYSALVGTMVTLSAVYFNESHTGVLSQLPLFLVYAIGIFVGAGGMTALVGLLVRRNNIRVELNVEQIGWIILSVGWLAYLYAALRYADGSITAVSAGLFISLGGFTRAAALIVLERQLERTVEGGANPETAGGTDARP